MDGSPAVTARSALCLVLGTLVSVSICGGCAGVQISRSRQLAPDYAGCFGLSETMVASVTQHRLHELPVGAPCKIQLKSTRCGTLTREFTTVEGELAEVTDKGLRIRTAKSRWHRKTSIVLASVTVSSTQPEEELLWIPREQILRVTYEAWHWPARSEVGVEAASMNTSDRHRST